MQKVGIIGAGNMGSGIAQKTAQEGLHVVLVDMKPEFVERGLQGIRSTLSEAVERKILRAEQVEEIMGRIQGTTDLAATRDCDLVIEAVFEDLDVKKDLFQKLDNLCLPKTILATNTSSFSVQELAQATNRPDRFVGLHFFYHPAKNRLLEIIPCATTSVETATACKAFSRLTGKTDILVKDGPGFAVNRFFVPWLNHATRILEAGQANVPTIDQAARDAFGIGMGPFKLMNVTGIPIAVHSCDSLASKLGPFYAPSKRLQEQFASNALWPLEGETDQEALGAVGDNLLAVIFYVASALLEEGITDITDIDLGAKVGLRWRRGPFELMNRMGIDKAYALVEKLLEDWPGVAMPDSLRQQKQKGEPWDIRYVKYTRNGILGLVTLSRPDAMNALNEVVVKQLDQAFQEAQADPETRAIVLEGAGKAFVAGADIGFFIRCIRENRLDDNLAFTRYGQEVLGRIDESPKPVVAKVDGLALGGGLELALSADVMVTTPKATMGFPETGIGIYPGLGGTQRTSRFIGKELARYLIFTGRIISGETAHAIGLADYLFPPEELEDRILDMAAAGTLVPRKGKRPEELPEEFARLREGFQDDRVQDWLQGRLVNSPDPLMAKTGKIIASKAPLALKLASQIIDEGYGLPVSEAVKLELAHLKEIFSTEDALTGLTSVGRERPSFKGK